MNQPILIDDDMEAQDYLKHLLQEYPYDIEAAMVMSLLEQHTFPHPSLIKFLSYFSHIPKYQILHQRKEPKALDELFQKMSRIKQRNKAALHTHQFQIDACFYVKQYSTKIPYAHLPLDRIPFIDHITLHSQPFLDMLHPYHRESIQKNSKFLYKDLSIDPAGFYAVSMKIADQHGIVYFPKKELGIAIALSSLYEMVPPPTEVDFLLLYGCRFSNPSLSYYFDETNRIYIGLISGIDTHHHFLYIKDMITTLYNSICMEKKDLPVHGSMLVVQKQKQKKSFLLLGEDSTARHALMQSVMRLCKKRQLCCTPVFDDSGVLHCLDNDISATGSQIGTCISIDDLPRVPLLQEMRSSCCIQYHNQTTHMIIPFTAYVTTSQFHKLDAFYYMDNISHNKGIETIKQLHELKQIVKKGAYRDENGKQQESYFCNPYGCVQQKEWIDELLNDFLNMMFIKELHIARIYCRVSKRSSEKRVEELAEKLLDDL